MIGKRDNMGIRDYLGAYYLTYSNDSQVPSKLTLIGVFQSAKTF